MFDINCLSLNEVTSNEISTATGIEENFFYTSLNYVLESERNMIEINKRLYRSMLESGSDVILVNEGFSDFTSKVVGIISKFLSFVKNLWDRFIRAFNSIIRSDKYIIKNSDLIGKFDDSCEFDIEDYVYSFGQEGKDIPIIDAKATFQNELLDLDANVWDDSKSDKEKVQESKEKYDEFKNKINGDYYDSVRATVIGKSGGKITSEDYKNELFKVFRDDKDSKQDITIKSKNVDSAYQFVKEYKKALKSVEDTKKEIEEQYKSIKDYVSSLLKVEKDGNSSKVSIDFDDDINGNTKVAQYTVNSETLKYLNLFIKAKTDQVVEMSNIHAMAFTAKLEAFKECYKSSRSVCYKAITQVQKLKKD